MPSTSAASWCSRTGWASGSRSPTTWRSRSSYWLELALACDFADIFEVRGWRRAERGQFFAPEPSRRPAAVPLSRPRRTHDRQRRPLPPAARPAHGPSAARWDFTLRQPDTAVSWSGKCSRSETPGARAARSPPAASTSGEAAVEQHYRTWRQECSRWTTNVPKFDVVLRRAIDDLRALYMDVDGEDVISAGIPWYSTVFGRDSIITSLETLALNPGIARDTLRYLARRQGTREDPFTEEQPGRILHELRRGEMARAGEIPHVPYFGTVDATPLWLVLLHETWRWTGDDSAGPRAPAQRGARARLDRPIWRCRRRRLRRVRPHEREGPREPGMEGFGRRRLVSRRPAARAAYRAGRGAGLRVRRQDPHGRSVRQIRRARARRVARRPRPPRCAMRSASASGWRRRAPSRSRSTERSARATVTSNAGHLLWSRVPTAEQAASVTRRLLGPELFSGWGIRTLAAGHRGLQSDELSQRVGLAARQRTRDPRHGSVRTSREALPVIRGLHEAAIGADFQRLPELFCGMERQRGVRPGPLSGELLAPGVGLGRLLHDPAGDARPVPGGAGPGAPYPEPRAARFSPGADGQRIVDRRHAGFAALPAARRSHARECPRHGGRAASGTDRAGLSIALRSSPGRWTLAAAVLGSGAVFLESTVASVALPAMGRQFDLGFDGLQWVTNAYLLPLSALILLGGSLGDRYRGRGSLRWDWSASAPLAPCARSREAPPLCWSRELAKGAFGALVVPNSLAMLDEMFDDEDRGAAIGQWAGWSAVSTALGPLVGGWLVDAISWRVVFAAVVPFALAAALIAVRRVPEASSRSASDVGARHGRLPGRAPRDPGSRRRDRGAGDLLRRADSAHPSSRRGREVCSP